MRSSNPLVAIGITTLITVGAVDSGSAQASAPRSSSESAAASPQPLQPNLSKVVQPDRNDTGGLRDRSVTANLVAFVQRSQPVQDNEVTSPQLFADGRQFDRRLAEAADTAADTPTGATDESETSQSSEQLPPLEVPTETQASESSSSEPTVPTVPEAASTSPAVETPSSETAAAEASTDETPAVETAQTETPAPETSPSDTAPQPESTDQAPADEAPTDETPTEPAADTPEADSPATTEPTESDSSTGDTRVEVPDYLNPSPNPLDFPTTPEEVELQGTQPITLRQAVDLAIRNNPQLRQTRQQLDQAQAQLDQARAANNPTVSVNANLVQAGQENAVEVPQSPLGETETEIRSSDAATLSGNLEVNYALFTSGRRSSLIRAAEGQVRVQQLEIEQQLNELILQVADAYYDLQQSGAQVRIFQSNLEQAEQSLRDAEALERAGVGTRFDVLQAQVDVANAQQELTQQLSNFDISRRNLAQLLNASNSVDLTAADPIEVAGDWNLSLEQSIVQAFRNRAELEQQLIQRESAEEQRQAALAQLGPQVNLQGALGVNNNLDAGNGFLSNYQVGVGVSLNVFDGGAARAEARAQETNIAQAESQFENLQNQIRFQTEQAYSQLQASATNIETTALAVQQAAEALRLARLRFQAGVGTQTDVLRQQTALAQTQVNNLQAILGYNRALATLQRQVSNLPENFLSDAP